MYFQVCQQPGVLWPVAELVHPRRQRLRELFYRRHRGDPGLPACFCHALEVRTEDTPVRPDDNGRRGSTGYNSFPARWVPQRRRPDAGRMLGHVDQHSTQHMYVSFIASIS